MSDKTTVEAAWVGSLPDEFLPRIDTVLATPSADFADLARVSGLDPVHYFSELASKCAWMEIARLKGHEGTVASVGCSPAGARLATWSADRTVFIRALCPPIAQKPIDLGSQKGV